ncbi:MAG: type II secretion system protein [Lachnospiraceae bacterium]|nr:type II secretion system protein [Lachnospiraceae bacterium]
MNKIKTSKGFTLIEVIVVLVILTILASIFFPSLTDWIDNANEKACFINRKQILLHYHDIKAIESAEGRDVKLSDVLAGKYEICADEVAALSCPAGGEYTADDENGTIICSIHGDMAESETGGKNGQEESDGIANTTECFYIGGDGNYKVSTWGNIETFNPEQDGQPGTDIPNGTVFYYQGDYYLFRDNQCFMKSTNIPSFVSNYGVKIDYSGFKTPGPETSAGDLKLVDDKIYVFFPYMRYVNDYLNTDWWREVALS